MQPTPSTLAQTRELAELLYRRRPLFVLTGAGCSTASGIPDYRDQEGRWKHSRPVLFQDFKTNPAVRQRYWARSLAGWGPFAGARPNGAHRALASLEQAGFIHQLVTQNVDGLHQRAGSRRVIDLHGRLDAVVCLSCGRRSGRGDFQERLRSLNPTFRVAGATPAPDGDAGLACDTAENFVVPDCLSCGGVVKPAVVFFGEAVPPARVERSLKRLTESAALLVLGSSLMVFSGYRFCRAAAELRLPIVAVNLGKTRADELMTLKLQADCDTVLPGLVELLVPAAGRR